MFHLSSPRESAFTAINGQQRAWPKNKKLNEMKTSIQFHMQRFNFEIQWQRKRKKDISIS